MGSRSSRTFSTARPAGSASTMNQLAPLLLGFQRRFRRGARTRNWPAIRSSPHRNSAIPIANASRLGTKRKILSCALTKGVAMVRPIRILLVEDDYIIIRIGLNNALVEAGFE